MEYKIVQAKSTNNAPYLLTDKVNFLMQKGWKPQGGITSLLTPKCFYYYQAMVREDDWMEENNSSASPG